MKKTTHKLKEEDFARLFGIKTKDLPKNCKDLILKSDFSYIKLDNKERDEVILSILKKIESKELSIAGKQEIKRWKKDWGEILKNFKENDYNLAKLVPQYMRKALFARLYKDYIVPQDYKFWVNWFNIFRQWIFEKYLKNIENIHEFGCGAGQNLAVLAKIFPDKKLYGYDWVKPPTDIINLMAKKHGYNLKGQVFNMFSPNNKMNIPKNSAILTIHSLEQMGPNFKKFLDFVIKKSPDLCINIEPLCELYDTENLVDYLAVKFHKKRNYLQGYLDRLCQLEKEGKVEILKIQRIPFGSLFHDSYSYIIWKPKK